jgi:hypothetical protein
MKTPTHLPKEFDCESFSMVEANQSEGDRGQHAFRPPAYPRQEGGSLAGRQSPTSGAGNDVRNA